MATKLMSRRGVAVKPRNRFEYYAWIFMRVSGVILILMALFHFIYMHFYLRVDTITFDVVSFRWQKLYWRVFDFLLLFFAFAHGMNGARVVLEDYTPKAILKPVLALLAAGFVVLILAGAWIIFTFKS